MYVNPELDGLLIQLPNGHCTISFRTIKKVKHVSALDVELQLTTKSILFRLGHPTQIERFVLCMRLFVTDRLKIRREKSDHHSASEHVNRFVVLQREKESAFLAPFSSW